MRSAMARVAEADAARAPNFRISCSLGLDALTLAGLTHGASVVSVLLAAVTVPIFDGGTLRAQVRAQQAALDQAGSTYKAAVTPGISNGRLTEITGGDLQAGMQVITDQKRAAAK